MKFVISSGHSKFVSGARDLIDEVTEARSVVTRVNMYLKELGATSYVFHDNTSKTQNENLRTIVNYHNSKVRDYDISIHFNYGNTDIGGVEVYYYDQKEKASQLSKKLAEVMKIPNRGAKQDKGLYFLKNTAKPALLIEVCFVNVKSNTDAYGKNFDLVCRTIAETLVGLKLSDKKYRILTGTFTNKADAEKKLKEIKKLVSVATIIED